MDHDSAKENWTRPTNKYHGCACPPWRYNPQHPAPISEDCETHSPIARRGVTNELIAT